MDNLKEKYKKELLQKIDQSTTTALYYQRQSDEMLFLSQNELLKIERLKKELEDYGK